MKQNCKKDVPRPENFEKFDQAFGYAIYSHTFTNGVPKTLSIKHFRDLAYVFIGDEYQVENLSIKNSTILGSTGTL
jgi:hypothetical protein